MGVWDIVGTVSDRDFRILTKQTCTQVYKASRGYSGDYYDVCAYFMPCYVLYFNQHLEIGLNNSKIKVIIYILISFGILRVGECLSISCLISVLCVLFVC